MAYLFAHLDSNVEGSEFFFVSRFDVCAQSQNIMQNQFRARVRCPVQSRTLLIIDAVYVYPVLQKQVQSLRLISLSSQMKRVYAMIVFDGNVCSFLEQKRANFHVAIEGRVLDCCETFLIFCFSINPLFQQTLGLSANIVR